MTPRLELGGRCRAERIETRCLAPPSASAYAVPCGWPVWHDDDVAATPLGNRHLFDVSLKRGPDGSARRSQKTTVDRCKESAPLNMAVLKWRCSAPLAQPVTALTLAMDPGHVGCGRSCVDENEARGIEVRLRLKSWLMRYQDDGSFLLACMNDLCLHAVVWRIRKHWIEPNPKKSSAAQTSRLVSSVAVSRTASKLSRIIYARASSPCQRSQPAEADGTDADPFCGLAVRRSCIDIRQNQRTKIKRKALLHPHPPPGGSAGANRETPRSDSTAIRSGRFRLETDK